MSLINNFMTTTRIDESKDSSLVMLKQLLYYAIFIILGLLGGASGVALAVGLVIIGQLVFLPAEVFWPNVLLLTIVAVLLGLSISWLLSRVINRIHPPLFEGINEHGLQVTMILSVLTSLLQTFLFMRGL